MEDNRAKSANNKLKNAENGQNRSTFDSVMHEYDIIEQPDNKYLNESENNVSTRGSEQEISKFESGNQQISSRNRLSSSDRTNTSDKQLHVNQCPRLNCKEKIIFCIDASAEMDKPIFRSRAGDRMSSKHLTKRGLSIFLQSKQRLDRKHEVALILLQESAIWTRDFTNTPRDILIALEDVVDTPPCESCNLGSVFDTILENVEIPKVEGDVSVFPPPYTVRLILLYGRSNCLPQIIKKESFNVLNSSPYFFMDAIYLHEPLSDENKCQEVFDSLCDLDQKGLSYIVGASRNPTKVYDAMSQMLAHPLQRPPQSDAAYRIGSSVPQPENG